MNYWNTVISLGKHHVLWDSETCIVGISNKWLPVLMIPKLVHRRVDSSAVVPGIARRQQGVKFLETVKIKPIEMHSRSRPLDVSWFSIMCMECLCILTAFSFACEPSKLRDAAMSKVESEWIPVAMKAKWFKLMSPSSTSAERALSI